MSERETEEELQEATELATELVTGLGAGQSRMVPVISPARTPVPIVSRNYSPYSVAQPAYGATLTAKQALATARRLQATNAANAGGHLYGRPAPPPPSYPQRPIGSKKQYGVGILSPVALLRALSPGARASMRVAASPIAQTASQALTSSLMQQAMPANQFGIPSPQAGATWARMKQGVQLATGPASQIYAGVTVQAGEQVAAAASAVNVGGYSNYYRQIWVKRGQTFDSSSWKTGWVHESTLTISNVPAKWGQQGFGALEDQMNEVEMVAELIGLGAGAMSMISAHAPQGFCPERTWHVQLGPNGVDGRIRTWDDPEPPPAGWKIVPVCVPNCGPGEVLNLLVGQHTLLPESDGWFYWRVIETVRMGIRPMFRCVPGESSAPVAPRPPSVPHPQPPVGMMTPYAPSSPTIASPQPAQSSHQALVSSGGPSNKLVDDFRNNNGGKCPLGQAVFGKYANGQVVQFDADWFNALKNNPSMRTGLVSLFCDWPHGQAEAPISARGGFQHMKALRGLPEDEVEMAAEVLGLGAGGALSPTARSLQPLGPKSVYVDGPFELVDAQRVLLAGTINGETVQGGFAGPFVRFWPGVPYWVRGYVQYYPPAGLIPARYIGNVTVHIGQKTQVNMWMNMQVASPLASPEPPISGRPTWGLPPPPMVPVRTPMMAASRAAGSRMMAFAGLRRTR